MRNNITFTLGPFTYRFFRNAAWLKIFDHNSHQSGPMTSETEALNVNQPGKYSIIGEIHSHQEEMKYEGKFEFLLEYPMLSKEFNWWRQSKFPIDDPDNNLTRKTVEGYEDVSIAWTFSNWGGLAKSVIEENGQVPALLDGHISFIMRLVSMVLFMEMIFHHIVI